MTLDSFDQAILSIVQRDNQLTHAAIGEQVNLSATSVRRRLTKLRKEGVIQADVSIVSSDKTSVTAIVEVSFQKETLETNEAFKQRMRDAPEVSQCYAVSGEVDFILIVHAPSLSAYETWGEQQLMSDPLIRRYDTHIVWSRVKFSTALPLEA